MWLPHFLMIYSNKSDEQLPDIIWCREPFLEALKDIKDIEN